MLKITKETDNLYTPEYGVPTLHLGDGNTIVFDIHGDDGLHGIGFSVAEENNGVGHIFADCEGRSVSDAGVFFQILTDNPQSIDVVIDKLQRAKAAILKELDASYIVSA